MLATYWRIIIRPNLGKIALIGAVSLLTAVAEVASIGLVIPVVALFSGANSPSGQKFLPLLESAARGLGLALGSSGLLLLTLGGVLFFIVLKSVLSLGLGYLTAFVSWDTKRRLTVRMFTAYAHARFAEFARRDRGAIVKDIEGPADSMGYVVYYCGLSLAAAGQLALILGFLTWLSPGLTLVMGAVGLLYVFLSRAFLQERIANLGRAEYPLEQAVSGVLVETVDGARLVKAHSLADRLAAKLDDLFSRRMKFAVDRLWFPQIPKIGFEFVGMLIVVLLIGLARWVPSLGLDFPALAAFVLGLRQITPAASALNTNIFNMAQYLRHVEVIEETLTRLSQEEDRGRAPLPDVVRELNFESVSFAYPEKPDHKIFRSLSLSFSRGKVTAIVGETGAGKTTAADLIIRLHEPDSGRITANGTDISRFSLTGWRWRIGYVGQDVFLFNATLANNIAALDDKAAQADIVRAAQLAQIHDFIVSLPKGYDTKVGDRGVKLSGGQRQRIAVARAIMRRPEILILDEATSHLDNLTERALHTAIDFIRKETVVILIAHRLSTVEDADEIIVLESGQVVESGTHTDLMMRKGLYSRLYGAAHISRPSAEIFADDL